MLNFLKHNPVHPGQFLRLIGEKTAPNFFWSDDTRCENRNNRTIPVSISPWGKGKPELEPMQVGISKDISDNGLCIICPFNVEDSQVVLGIHVKEMEFDEPMFFLVDVTSVRPFAKGFWQVGVKAIELLNTNFRKQLKGMIPAAIELLECEAEDTAAPTDGTK